MFVKIDVLKNLAIFAGNTISRNLFLNKVSDLRPPTQVFSCEYCKTFKNSFFYRTPLLASSHLLAENRC